MSFDISSCHVTHAHPLPYHHFHNYFLGSFCDTRSPLECVLLRASAGIHQSACHPGRYFWSGLPSNQHFKLVMLCWMMPFFLSPFSLYPFSWTWPSSLILRIPYQIQIFRKLETLWKRCSKTCQSGWTILGASLFFMVAFPFASSLSLSLPLPLFQESFENNIKRC